MATLPALPEVTVLEDLDEFLVNDTSDGGGEPKRITRANLKSALEQTGAEIKSAYEGEADTNAFTDALLTKLNNIEANATADLTAAEIEALLDAYYGSTDWRTGGGGGGSVPTQTAATIAALEALNTSSMNDGHLVYVEEYATGTGSGGGVFRWDSSSTAESNGITVFVPSALQSSEQTFTTQRDLLRGDRGNLALPHQNLIWGSVQVVYSDGGITSVPDGSYVTDIELHGHQHVYSGGAEPHVPFVNHAEGELVPQGDGGSNIGGHKLRRLIDEHTAGVNFDTHYKYATGAGRWIRVLRDDEPVTPAMIGCTPNDSTVNDVDRLGWLLRYSKDNAARPILIDAWYYYKGTLELFDGCTILQTRSHADAGLRVCPWSTIPAIDHLADNYDDTQPAALLKKNVVAILVENGTKKVTIKGLRLDGNLANNDDFLSDPNYDTTDLVGSDAVSQQLREGPICVGLSVTVYQNRVIENELRIILEDVRIGEYLGSCLHGAVHTRNFIGRNVTLGSTVSGRTKYGASGDWQNLRFYGYSRSAIERQYTQQTFGHYYSWKDPEGNTPERVWPENAVIPTNLISLVPNFDTEWNQPTGQVLEGIDWDFDGVPTYNGDPEITAGCLIRGGPTRIRGRMITDTTAYAFVPLGTYYRTNEGIYTVHADLDIVNRNTTGVIPLSADTGGWHNGSHIRMRIRDWRDLTTGNGAQVLPSLPTKTDARGPSIFVGDPIGSEEVHVNLNRQILHLHIESDLVHQETLRLRGLAGNGQTVTPSDYMETEIHLSGRIIGQTNKIIIADNGQGPANGIGAIPVRVFCEGLTFMLWEPGTSYRGNPWDVDQSFEIMKLRNCRLDTGEVSEESGTVSVTGADLTSSYYDVSTNLLWTPLEINFSPRSAKAGEHFRYVEAVGTYIQPTLRFHFSGSEASGDALDFSWSAQVSPW